MTLRNTNTYRGGRPRQAGPRTTTFLSPHDVSKVLRAAEFARKVDRPLNTHVTIHFPSDIDEEEAPRLVAEALRNFRQWLRRRKLGGALTTHLWVRERVPACASHVHVLLHTPTEVRRELTNSRFARFFPRRSGIDSGQINDRAGRNSGTPILVQFPVDDQHERRWPFYIVKGIEERHAAAFHVSNVERQGTIVGQRVGVAENIGATEWRRWQTDFGLGSRPFALKMWAERASMAKGPTRRKVDL